MSGPIINSVLVTGASGFLGTHVIRHLAQRGLRVRAMARGSRPLNMPATDWVRVDRYHPDDPAFAGAFPGMDAVVNLAGRAHVLNETAADPLAAFREANVAVARAALSQAARQSSRRFIQLSSIAAVCSSSDEIVTDATPPQPTTPYGVSKLEADTLLAEEAGGTGVGVTSLRPPLIFGAGMGGNPLLLFRAVARGLPLPLGNVDNLRSLVYVENVAAAIAACLANQQQPVGPFVLSDSPAISTAEFVRQIARALHRPPRLVGVPGWTMRSAASMLRAMPSFLPMPVSAEQIERLTSSLVIDSRRFWDAVGNPPPVPFPEGLERTARWFATRNESVA